MIDLKLINDKICAQKNKKKNKKFKNVYLFIYLINNLFILFNIKFLF